MTRNPLSALYFSLVISLLHGIQASAQTNQQLLQERLISPAVYELLNSRGANTPLERLEVIQEACGAHQLSRSDWGNTRRWREY